MKTSSRAAQSIASAPPFSAGRILVGPDYRAVDKGGDVVSCSQRFDNPLPHPTLSPAGEAAGLACAVLARALVDCFPTYRSRCRGYSAAAFRLWRNSVRIASTFFLASPNNIKVLGL